MESDQPVSVSVPRVTQAVIPVSGSDTPFPIRRIFCVGRNYAEHAIEMGHDPDREPPFFFTKPADAAVAAPVQLPYPGATSDLHHEVELVVALGSGGSDLSSDTALDHVFGYGVGLDMTRRDLQATAKKMGRPWDMAKGFDQSAPMTPLRTAADIGHPSSGRISLTVNGELRQEGDLSQQIWNVPETIAYLSTLVELRGGDLIMTGTPSGVAAVVTGDELVGEIQDIGTLTVSYR